MTREEVINGLQEVIDYEIIVYLYRTEAIECAIEMLKAQEPRVMTLEGVKEKIGSGECVFTECEKEGQWMRYGDAKLSVDQGDSCRIAFLISRRGDNPYVRWWMIYYENYNKTWRCWSRKPTDAQREATPWG